MPAVTSKCINDKLEKEKEDSKGQRMKGFIDNISHVSRGRSHNLGGE